MIACRPKTDRYKYTIFKNQVEQEIKEQASARLEWLVKKPDRYLILARDNTTQGQLINFIEAENRVLLVRGAANDDRTACRLAGQRACLQKQLIPVNVNLGPAWHLETIYYTIADHVSVAREEIKDKIKHSPPIVFFFDLNTTPSPDSLRDLQQFFTQVRNGHKFVVFHNNPDLVLDGQRLDFQPALGWIADHEPSRLTSALCLASEQQILDFVANLNMCGRDHLNCFKIIEALTTASFEKGEKTIKWFEREEISVATEGQLQDKLRSFCRMEGLASGQKKQIDDFLER